LIGIGRIVLLLKQQGGKIYISGDRKALNHECAKRWKKDVTEIVKEKRGSRKEKRKIKREPMNQNVWQLGVSRGTKMGGERRTTKEKRVEVGKGCTGGKSLGKNGGTEKKRGGGSLHGLKVGR